MNDQRATSGGWVFAFLDIQHTHVPLVTNFCDPLYRGILSNRLDKHVLISKKMRSIAAKFVTRLIGEAEET